ncbi:MAG: CGNR zinc finger domain-containing protein [Candidatus Limnocylindrales bacterium]
MTGSQVTSLLEVANARHGPGAHAQPPAVEHDHLASAEEARSYLSEQGLELPLGLPSADELARLREIADLPFAFDRLPESEWRPKLANVAGRHLFRFNGFGTVEPAEDGWDAFGAQLVAALFELTEIRGRLRHCANPSCGWLFIDESKNHSRVWCEMATCGSRAKMTRYRRRLASTNRTQKARPARPSK